MKAKDTNINFGSRIFDDKHFGRFVRKPLRKTINFFLLIKQNIFDQNLFSITAIKSPNVVKKNIIAFSLFGNAARYTGNLKRVIRSYNQILPDWKCRIYAAGDVDPQHIDQLLGQECEVFTMQGTGIDFRYTLWRFLAIEDDKADAVIIRDLDSIATGREKIMIEQWLSSAKKFHIIRDHENHGAPIMAGMWGAKKTNINIKENTKHHLLGNHYGVDQEFLYNMIYPLIKNDVMIHDSFPRYPGEDVITIPYQDNEGFIGEWLQ